MENNAYRRIKATNKKLEASNFKLRVLLILSTILAVACVVGIVSIGSIYIVERDNNIELRAKVKEQTNTISLVSSIVKDQKDTIIRLSKVSAELDNENTLLVATLKSQTKELDSYKEREELYDLYEYAIVREYDNSRTDINYEDIKSLQDLSIEKGLGKDAVAVVLAISMNESQGYANVKNKESSASGLAGLLKSTAKYSYEKLLENGDNTYDPSYVFDSETNLQMSLAYIAYLKDLYGEDNKKIILAYRGENDTEYINKICNYLGVSSLSELDI